MSGAAVKVGEQTVSVVLCKMYPLLLPYRVILFLYDMLYGVWRINEINGL